MTNLYKQLTASKKQTIKKFVESQGHTYQAGAVFIQITEPEELSSDKSYLATEDGTNFLTGNDLKKAVKAPLNNRKAFTLDPAKHNKYTFYVEVRSHNKQVLNGTKVVVRTPACGKRKNSEEEASGSSKRPGAPASGPTSSISPNTSNGTTSTTTSAPLVRPTAPSAGDYEEIQIAFSYDTTGSMSACIEQVKKTVSQTIKRLLQANTKIQIAVIAHGDYGDEDISYSYLFKHQDFSNDESKLVSFIENVGRSTGYPAFPEAYEYVMFKARTELSWKEKANKCLVMIGDAIPHERGSRHNKYGMCWREEAQALKEANIKVYAVKCLAWDESKMFWRQLASMTNGFFIELAQFNAIADFMIAISMRETAPESLENFSEEIRARDGNLTRNMRQLFATLTGNEVEADPVPEDLSAVESGRFQVLDVDRDESIKEFVIRNGAEFQKGKGFYEFMKPEEVQGYKEVVLMDKTTGDMFTGDRARELAGIGAHVKGKKQKPPPNDKWTMFIQSTSYNRKLVTGTKFLYEASKDPVTIE